LVSVTRIVGANQLGIVFRFGRPLDEPRGPGRVWLIPGVDRLVLVDMGPLSIHVEREDVVTSDGVPLVVSARIDAHVVDATAAVMRVADYRVAIFQLARTALRAMFKRYSLEETRSDHGAIETAVLDAVADAATSWGVTVERVQIEG
jgi:regulator of protease activity HflC (stomatin/prohibitin superfamily)